MREKASVLGIGRLGLCFALTLERGGYEVVGSDIRQNYVESILDGTFISYEPNVNTYLAEARHFRPTTDLQKAVAHSDILFVAVRTESLPDGSYNHTQIEQLMGDLERAGPVDPKHLVICCNVNPGCCDLIHERMNPLGYIVSYNPEWVAQGTILQNQAFPDLVVIGQADEAAGEEIATVYSRICRNNPVVHRMDRRSAELTKISLNCFLTTKISYANMIGQIAVKSGLDPAPILAAIGDDSRISPKYLKYGFGFGGPCFSRDNRSLVRYAESVGAECRISKAVMETNERHLAFQVDQFIATHDPAEPVVLESVTYKPGTVILEESQQLFFAVRLAQQGYRVTIHEHPEVIRQLQERYGELFQYAYRGLAEQRHPEDGPSRHPAQTLSATTEPPQGVKIVHE